MDYSSGMLCCLVSNISSTSWKGSSTSTGRAASRFSAFYRFTWLPEWLATAQLFLMQISSFPRRPCSPGTPYQRLAGQKRLLVMYLTCSRYEKSLCKSLAQMKCPSVCLSVTSVACAKTALAKALINGLFVSLFLLVIGKVSLVNLHRSPQLAYILGRTHYRDWTLAYRYFISPLKR